MISRVKGTQDFLDCSLFNNIVERTRVYVQKYHFTEIATPILEPLELFSRSLGTYTDVVSKEMFLIQAKDDQDECICLRPEATAPTMRAFLNANKEIPWKVFMQGPMFRYERPQKGRFRQFHQINIEVIGSSSVMQDVHCIKMLDRFFSQELLLNNYALTLNFLGCPSDRVIYRDKLKLFLEKNIEQLCDTCKIRKDHNSLRIFDCKSPVCQTVYTRAPFIADHVCVTCAQEWQQIQNGLSLLSVSYSYVPQLVRGLDYYNKTVFEFVSDNLGAQNAFCGGGRYDQLAHMLGSKHDYPSFGAAIGIERLMLLLEPQRDRLIAQIPALHVIMPMASEQLLLALLLADTLQSQGLCIEVFTDYDSIKSMMRHANKLGARFALILGSQEQETRSVTIKNMMTGMQETILQIDAAQYLKRGI